MNYEGSDYLTLPPEITARQFLAQNPLQVVALLLANDHSFEPKLEMVRDGVWPTRKDIFRMGGYKVLDTSLRLLGKKTLDQLISQGEIFIREGNNRQHAQQIVICDPTRTQDDKIVTPEFLARKYPQGGFLAFSHTNASIDIHNITDALTSRHTNMVSVLHLSGSQSSVHYPRHSQAQLYNQNHIPTLRSESLNPNNHIPISLIPRLEKYLLENRTLATFHYVGNGQVICYIQHPLIDTLNLDKVSLPPTPDIPSLNAIELYRVIKFLAVAMNGYNICTNSFLISSELIESKDLSYLGFESPQQAMEYVHTHTTALPRTRALALIPQLD